MLGVEDVEGDLRGPGDVSAWRRHLRRLYGDAATRPERLLASCQRGLEYVPLQRADECCGGFGGSFAAAFYPGIISGAMVQDKAAFIEQANVGTVVATDAGCLMNIGGCLRRCCGSPVRVLHLV